MYHHLDVWISPFATGNRLLARVAADAFSSPCTRLQEVIGQWLSSRRFAAAAYAG